MHHQELIFQDVPTDEIRHDPDNPRHGVGTEEEDRRLRASIEKFGILDPLLVCPADGGGYFIIDGVRRYRFALELGLQTLPCTVHPKLKSVDRNILRFQMQATFKPLTKAEREGQERRMRELGVEPPGGFPVS
jgi:ParB/RepB/Spo0J family partition protein